MKRGNNSERASALRIILSLALVSVSAILLATGAQTKPEKTTRQVAPAHQATRAIVTPAAPTPTPCGRIAFTKFGNPATDSAIWVMNADGSSAHSLTNSGSDIFDEDPSFSADGSKIAFTHAPANGTAAQTFVYIMNDDGSGQSPLVNGDHGSLNADGSKIAFYSAFQIHLINSDGSGGQLLTNSGSESSFEPSLSADGSKVAFVYQRNDGTGGGIGVVDADGSNLKHLTDKPNAPGTFDDAPSINGDGSKVVYVCAHDNFTSSICVIDANGGGSGGTLVADGEYPSFSPDGKWIVFGRGTDIFLMTDTGADQHQVGGADPAGGAKLPFPSLSGCPPFVIGLEVTQGVQDLNNSVPLVEHKKTFVRAHVRNPASGLGRISGSASLTATDTATGTVLGTITNSNGGITIPRFPVRLGLSQSFLFEIPPAWRTGTVEFSLAGNAVPLGCTTGGDACSKATVTFQPVDPLNMKFVFLTWRSGGIDHAATAADLPEVVGEYLGQYPINLLQKVIGAERVTLDPCTRPNVERILRFVNELRNSDCSSGACQEFYQGLLAERDACDPAAELNGLGDLSGHVSVAFVDPTHVNISTRIHEQGHVMGLEHTDYNASRSLQPAEHCENFFGFSTPCTMLELDGTLSKSKDQFAADTVYGWDINSSSSQRVYPPETADFMSYGHPRWPSRVNYELLFDKVKSSAAPIPKFAQNDVTASQTVIIDGSVQLNGAAGELGSVFVKTTPVNVTLPSPGDFSIRLDDAQGAELARYSFNPIRNSEDNLSAGGVSLLLPWDTNAKRIVLLHNEDILDSRDASASSPTVSVTFPNGGEVLSDPSATFSWTAGDADGDALTYALEYSADNGTTWETLAIDWDSETLPVDLTKLHGSNQALIRVTACDGFNCAHAQSPGTFTVPDHAPTAEISSPENTRLYVGDQTIILEGTSFDIEDGTLGDSSLTWSSDLNGPLGTGSSLVIDAMTLQEGTHTITLTATDSTGHVGSTSIAIRVFRIFAVSRKTHGNAGDFDVDLPLTGTHGIECRSGGATNDHTIIITFPDTVTITGSPQAQVTAGTATVGSGGADNGGIATVIGNVVTIPLTNVPNGQTITVTLHGVNDGTGTVDLAVPMSVLSGDTNADRFVDSSDISQVKAQSGVAVSNSNFREDLNTDGFIDSSDISFVKSKSGTAVPATWASPSIDPAQTRSASRSHKQVSRRGPKHTAGH